MTTLINGEGIIDSDYTGEIKVGLYRFPDGGVSNYDEEEPLVIGHGDRIAQGELVKNLSVVIQEANTDEFEKNRALSTRKDGGFGSTGR